VFHVRLADLHLARALLAVQLLHKAVHALQDNKLLSVNQSQAAMIARLVAIHS